MPDMQGLWLENKKLSLRTDLPIPEPAPGEALVHLRQGGICGTDLEMVRGYYPFIGVPGHEFVAEVVATGSPDVNPGWIGQRVVGEINLVCRECIHCRSGRSTHCLNRTTLGINNRPGVFSEYFTLPIQNLHRVPEGVPDDAAVLTEPLAAALEILQQIQIHPEDTVLLVGAGRLGQLIAQVLAMTGCQLSVVARHAQQMDLLANCGIHTVNVRDVPLHNMDIVVEATGSIEGYDLARRAVRPRGTIALKSTYHGTITVDFSELVVQEITLVGSRCGPFEPALRLMASGKVILQPLIAAHYPLVQGLTAFSYAGSPGVLKVVLHP